MRKIILALLILLMAAAVAAADTLYLRDGRTVQGTVLGFVRGRFAVRLTAAIGPPTTMQTSEQSSASARIAGEIGDVVFIRPRDVQRVEIEGRSLSDARYITRTVQVELGPNWIDSGIDLRRGDRIQVDATGTIMAGRTRITPAGLGTTDPYAPLPRAAEGALIGAIGDDPSSPIIEIGSRREIVADRDGRLYLTANRSSYTDARGTFTAQIRREIDFQRMAGSRRTDSSARSEDDEFDDLFGTSSGQSPAPTRRRRTPRSDDQTQPTQPTTTTTERTMEEKTISVPGNSRGTDTGVELRSGDSVNLTATGTVVAGRRAGEVSPDGGNPGFGALLGTRPVPNAGVGALVGYIRLTSGQETQRFLVGSQQTLTAPADGRLILLINDDDYSDNSGSFNVRIVRTNSQTSQTGGGFGSSTQGAERTVTVYADARSATDTGVDVRAGNRVTFSANGSIYSRNTDAISPEGNRRYDSQSVNYPMRDAPFGALIGFIRTSDGRETAPFLVGSQQTITAQEDGRLFLLVNDDSSRDNSGSFRVRILY